MQFVRAASVSPDVILHTVAISKIDAGIIVGENEVDGDDEGFAVTGTEVGAFVGNDVGAGRNEIDAASEGFVVGEIRAGSNVGRLDVVVYGRESDAVGYNEVDGADECFVSTGFNAGTVVSKVDVLVYDEELLNALGVLLDDK